MEASKAMCISQREYVCGSERLPRFPRKTHTSVQGSFKPWFCHQWVTTGSLQLSLTVLFTQHGCISLIALDLVRLNLNPNLSLSLWGAGSACLFVSFGGPCVETHAIVAHLMASAIVNPTSIRCRKLKGLKENTSMHWLKKLTSVAWSWLWSRSHRGMNNGT